MYNIKKSLTKFKTFFTMYDYGEGSTIVTEDKLLYIKKMQNYFASDERRINHALNVLDYAEQIMDNEDVNNFEKRVITITAILHDIGVKMAETKYGLANPRLQEIEGPPVAQVIMAEVGEQEDIVARVKYIIGGHHTAAKINGLDFQIIWESDLLVNLAKENWNLDRAKLENIVNKHFKTSTGIRIARKKYLS